MNYVVEATLYLIVPWLLTYAAVTQFRRTRQRGRR